MTFIVQTAFPPSTNTLFKNREGGRHKSERYEAWIQVADIDFRRAMIARNNPPPLTGPLAAIIELFLPDGRKRDPDNFCKALLDRAVAHGAIEDDDKIIDLRVKKVTGWPKRGARLVIWPIEEAA